MPKRKKRRGRKPKEKTHYVDNPEFCRLLIKWKKDYEKDPNTVIPEQIWVNLYNIAFRYARKGQFATYTYKEDFIQDAMMHCISKLTKFDPTRTNNPFAYFTQTVKNVYLHFLKDEKRESFKKDQMLHQYDDNIDNNITNHMETTKKYKNQLHRKVARDNKEDKYCGF